MATGVRYTLTASLVLFATVSGWAKEASFGPSFQILANDACVDCHDGSDSERWDLTKLSTDLSDEETARKWERIYDRVALGEMPPGDSPRPSAALAKPALASIKLALSNHIRADQAKNGRVRLRRLNRTEYGYAIQDLFQIDKDLSSMIPAENVSSTFDTVYSNQGLSPLHIESLLKAADVAISEAIELGVEPEHEPQRFLYTEQEGVQKHLKKDDHKVIRVVDDAVVMFSDASWIFKVHDLNLEHNGRYRVRAKAAAFQSDKPVTLTLNAGNYKAGSKRVLGYYDLEPGKPQVVEAEAVLGRGEYLFPAAIRLESPEGGKNVWNVGGEKYEGSGVALEWIEVEGPLGESWPPKRTQDLLQSIEVRKRDNLAWINDRHVQYELIAGDDPAQQIEDIVKQVAPRVFRRPLTEGEVAPFVQLAKAALKEGRDVDAAVRVALRNVLNSPEFLFFDSEPGALNDHDLAERLSFFLWKSVPDDELFRLASKKRLAEPKVLRQQVERMLQDPKSERFVNDFVGQWLRLVEIDATAPDRKLYPEFDDLLKLSMLEETRRFVRYLIENDLSTDNLIDSDFTMLNRRLAEHYGIDDVQGQEFRKHDFDAASLRGGLLTQASILKVTANGTVTSPVRRGNWVLTHLLGQPPNPPPPGIGAVEPDTRGAKTIRELLAKHRDSDSCASCHREIDPPGFALESFDVIGGFRKRYRSREHGDQVKEKLLGRHIWEYKLGPDVDATGQMADGASFADVREFKKLLMKQREQVARNVISNLLVYSTGAEISFADREVVESLVNKCRIDAADNETDFGFRTMIHEVVQSRLFRTK